MNKQQKVKAQLKVSTGRKHINADKETKKVITI
jgi:hypothetical protein